MIEKIPNTVLKQCGIKLMADCSRPVEEVPSRGRSMIYRVGSGETVRLRTSNDPVLVAVADFKEDGFKLNVEGTDYILLVMPVVRRQWGNVCGYLVPTSKVVAAFESSYPEIFRRNNQVIIRPDENVGNKPRALTIWFEDTGRPDGGFEEKWKQYRLGFLIDAREFEVAVSPNFENKRRLTSKPRKRSTPPAEPGTKSMNVGDVIADAREKISKITGLPIKSVKIEVRLGD